MSELEEKTSAWSDRLLEQYGKLHLPSLYDFLVGQEQLAVEIRRQNKELLRHSGLLQTLIDKFEETVEAEPEPVNEEKSAFLMQVMDLFFSLFQATEATSRQILGVVPGRTLFGKPSWRTSLEEVVSGYSSGLDVVREKMFGFIADAGIVTIAPQQGDSFDPRLHRAIERRSGGESRAVAKMIRYGYRENDKVLRPADVVIYE